MVSNANALSDKSSGYYQVWLRETMKAQAAYWTKEAQRQDDRWRALERTSDAS